MYYGTQVAERLHAFNLNIKFVFAPFLPFSGSHGTRVHIVGNIYTTTEVRDAVNLVCIESFERLWRDFGQQRQNASIAYD